MIRGPQEIHTNIKWTADDYKDLLELREQNVPILEIAEVLEKSPFSIISQLPWKTSTKLSEVLSELEDLTLQNKVINFYISDYEDLVDVEVDIKQVKFVQEKRARERKKRDDKIHELLQDLDIRFTTKEESGLEELVIKVFNAISPRSLSIKEIKERLVWIVGLSSLFSMDEYEILFSYYPDDGSRKKTYQNVSNTFDLPSSYISSSCRTSVSRLMVMVQMLGDDRENYSSWIKLDKLSYANMNTSMERITFPKIKIDYENLPEGLLLIEELNLNKTEIAKLHKANIFCVGNLEEFDYSDLRFEVGLESNLARKIYEIKEQHFKEKEIAGRV